MELLRQELLADFGDPDHLVRVLLRLGVAIVLGGILGWEREHEKKAAGMRTHMLVALGATLFTVVPWEEAKMSTADTSRVIQGIAAGIGFLGAGTILKLSDVHEIKGLTSAAVIWLTAAAGVAVGIGWYLPAVVSVTLTWFILYFMGRWEYRLKYKSGQ